MSYVSSDPNYTDRSSAGNPIERVGDLTGEPPTNESTNRDIASKMANLLEGLTFPANQNLPTFTVLSPKTAQVSILCRCYYYRIILLGMPDYTINYLTYKIQLLSS
jgi:hypothetical protein